MFSSFKRCYHAECISVADLFCALFEVKVFRNFIPICAFGQYIYYTKAGGLFMPGPSYRSLSAVKEKDLLSNRQSGFSILKATIPSGGSVRTMD